VDIAANAPAGKNLDAILGFDPAEELAVNFNFSYFNVGVDDSVVANNEIISRRNGPLEVAIDTKSAGELELAGDIRTFV